MNRRLYNNQSCILTAIYFEGIHLSVDLDRIIKTVYLDGVTHNLR
ncbi:MAG: hypothetical protein V7K70_18860 [Nostoc sp.]